MGKIYFKCVPERGQRLSQYVIRLDDAAPHAQWKNWKKIEWLLDLYAIKPLVGVIPNCKDPELNILEENICFWEQVHAWGKKGWTIAMHGYDHRYISNSGGMNPVNLKSEFAGVSLAIQRQKIHDGVKIFRKHGIDPKVFFAPSHTMDFHTIEALKRESNIWIISDTVANYPYSKWGMTFVPQQSGRVRKLPLGMVTFCYHPNRMTEADFVYLDKFLIKYRNNFIDFPMIQCDRKETIYDRLLRKIYFLMR